MGFDGGAVGSDAEAAQLSPADPKISTRLSNGKNRKLFIARLLFGRVLMGENMLLRVQIRARIFHLWPREMKSFAK
jgi:hypothetical protein